MRDLADKLQSKSISAIYSSKEKRAAQSAQILAEVLQVSVIEIDGMEERNWGEHIGKPWSEVSKVLEPMSLEERYKHTPKGGESWKSFERRLIRTVNKIAKENDKDEGIMAHGGTIRALVPHLLDKPKEESFKYIPPNASVKVFEFDGKSFSLI